LNNHTSYKYETAHCHCDKVGTGRQNRHS